MRVFYFTVLIVCLSSPCAQCAVEDEFVDPLDMLNYDRATKSMKKPKTGNEDPSSGHIPNDRCTIFLSRFVNILLKNTGLSVSVLTFVYVFDFTLVIYLFRIQIINQTEQTTKI